MSEAQKSIENRTTKQQTLTLKPNGQPVLIPTAHGIIKVWRDPDETRKVLLLLPNGLSGYFGDDRAIANSMYVTKDDHGNIIPRFKHLVPEVDEHGQLIGLTEPTVFKLNVPEPEEPTDELPG